MTSLGQHTQKGKLQSLQSLVLKVGPFLIWPNKKNLLIIISLWNYQQFVDWTAEDALLSLVEERKCAAAALLVSNDLM